MRSTLDELRDIRAALDAHSVVAISNAAGDITYANDKFCRWAYTFSSCQPLANHPASDAERGISKVFAPEEEP